MFQFYKNFIMSFLLKNSFIGIRRIVLAVCLLLSVQSVFSADSPKILSDYRLGSGDTISIHVFDESDLSVEVLLSDAGSFYYPFLGEIVAKGKTVGELEKIIETGLKGPYLIDPKISIIIMSYRQFFIYGEVENSGGYAYQPGLTLSKAISLAGGFTERASKSKIYIVSESSGAKEPVRIDMAEFIGPGDTITVPESFF